MEKVSEKISKKVVSIEDGDCVGYILSACFDAQLKTLEGFVVADEESEKEMFLPFAAICMETDEYVFVENSSKLSIAVDDFINPVGKIVFDLNGVDFGRVNDVITERKNVKKIITDKCEIVVNQIYSFGKDFIFISNKRKLNKKSKKIQKNVENLPKIQIQSVKIEENEENIHVKSFSKPMRISMTPTSVVGKFATCDIFGLNNELILHKNEVISQAKLAKAKKHGKLNFVIFNCRDEKINN